MGKNLNDEIANGKEAIAKKATAKLETSQEQRRAIQAAELLGGIKTANAIARAFADTVTSQSFRALQQFRDTKAYEAYGFTRFDDFLNDSDFSPMTKHEFYNREALIEKEGDQVFDVLNGLQLSLKARKQLGTGSLKIEGNEVVIGDERIPVSDSARVKEVIKNLAEKTSEQARTIERGKKELTSVKKERDTYKSGAKFQAGGTPFEQAQLSLLAAFHSLTSEARKLPDEQLEAVRHNTLALISEQRTQLEEALGLAAPHLRDASASAVSDDDLDTLGELM